MGDMTKILTAAWIVLGVVSLARADEAERDWTDQVEIGYQNGLYFKTTDGSYALKIQFLFQPQHQLIEGNVDAHSFLVKRGQIRLSGHYPSSRLKYKVMFEMPGTNGGVTLNVRDLWLDYQLHPRLSVRMGQFFVFYDQENFQPSWALQFVDRSIVSANLGFERDLGIEAHGSVARLAYHAYVMNGEGRNRINANTSFFTGASLVLNVLGKHGHLISDIDHSQTPHLLIGIAGILDRHNAGLNDNRVERVEADLAFKYRGFSVMGLANAARNATVDATDWGMLAQGGYFLIPSRFEVALRWAKVFRDGALGKGIMGTREMGGAGTYYVKKHQVKLQADYRRLWNRQGKAGQDDEVRIQMQMFF